MIHPCIHIALARSSGLSVRGQDRRVGRPAVSVREVRVICGSIIGSVSVGEGLALL